MRIGVAGGGVLNGQCVRDCLAEVRCVVTDRLQDFEFRFNDLDRVSAVRICVRRTPASRIFQRGCVVQQLTRCGTVTRVARHIQDPDRVGQNQCLDVGVGTVGVCQSPKIEHQFLRGTDTVAGCGWIEAGCIRERINGRR